MRKTFYFWLAFLACFVSIAQTAMAAVYDPSKNVNTEVKDGYYRMVLRNAKSADTKEDKDGTTTTDWALLIKYSKSLGYNTTMVTPLRDTLTSKNIELFGIDKLDRNLKMATIWHITKADSVDGQPTYHLKNCGPQDETYFYPLVEVCGQSNIYATTKEQCTFFARTKSWGSSDATEGTVQHGMQTLDKLFTAKEGGVMFVPTVNTWRCRLGSDKLVKLNAKDNTTNSSFELIPVDLGADSAWIALNEVCTDAKGLQLTQGNNPGQVSDAAAFAEFTKVLDEAIDKRDEGATDEVYKEQLEKLQAAIEKVKGAINPLKDGYYFVRISDVYSAAQGWPTDKTKWMVPFMDYAEREKLTAKTITNATGATTAWANSHKNYTDDAWWLGQGVDESTNEDLGQQYIWHFKDLGNGRYVLKNCAESSWSGDSTYFAPFVYSFGFRNKGEKVWTQFNMTGTARTHFEARNIGGNEYRFYIDENPLGIQLGDNSFLTANSNSANLGRRWMIEAVPAERITPKFLLNEAITEAGGIVNDWAPSEGTPGTLKMSIAKPMLDALEAARKVYADGGDYASAADALNAATDAVKEQLKDTLAASNDFDPNSYYRFVNADYRFKSKQGKVAGFYADDDNLLYWDTNMDEDAKNPNRYFRVIPQENGMYAIQNLGTGKYIVGTVNYVRTIGLDKEPKPMTMTNSIWTSDLCFNGGNRQGTTGKFEIFAEANPAMGAYSFHPYGASSGGATGPTRVETWRSTDGQLGAWKVEKVSDEEFLKEIVAAGNQKALNIKCQDEIDDADATLDKAYTYDMDMSQPLITNADGSDPANCQISTNAPHQFDYAANPYKFEYLIDPNANKFWISSHNAATQPTDGWPHYVQFDLKANPQKAIRFFYSMRRDDKFSPYDNLQADLGQAQRPIEFDVYATNDTANADSWTLVRKFANLPYTDNVQYRKFFSPAVVMDQPYQFIRIAVPHTINDSQTSGNVYWAAGFLQLYEAKLNEENSAYNYVSGMKEAVTELNAAMATAKTQLESGNVSEAAVNAIVDAKSKINELAVDTMDLSLALIELKVLRDSVHVAANEKDLQYGEITTAQKAEFDAYANEKIYNLMSIKPTKESVEQAKKNIPEVMAKLQSMRKTFELNKWYYITGTETSMASIAFTATPSVDRSYVRTKAPTWRYGHALMATDANAQNPWQSDALAYKVGPVRYGYYWNFAALDDEHWGDMPFSVAGGRDFANVTEDNGDGTTTTYVPDFSNGNLSDAYANPYAMWRIVKMEGEENAYAIQNRATGLYLGRNQDADWYVTQSLVPMPLGINILGSGEFEIVTDTVTNKYTNGSGTEVTLKGKPLHYQGSDLRAVWWSTNNANGIPSFSDSGQGYRTSSAFTFEAVEDPDAALNFPALNDNIQIKTFPFAVANIEAEDENFKKVPVKTYGLKSATVDNAADSISSVVLYEKASFEAGEPFVLVTGNPATAPTVDEVLHDSINMIITPVAIEDYNTTEPKTANGLVASLSGTQLLKKGLGLFEKGFLTVTNDSVSVLVAGQTGYIDPLQVQDIDTGSAATLTVKGNGILDAIRTAIIRQSSEYVNVYSIDGQLLRRHVNAADATRGLQKGIYIVGKQKVSVK
ncbi:MAG: hypothetical protein ILA34_04090 [Bacteroidaceae bacterium]|nr:hypothetical protein [Bacteroidaceae bacterium]